MLRSNLSTQPFYNTRAVRAGLVVFGVIAAALTVFNSVELWRLQRANRDFGQAVTGNENAARDLRQKARTIQQALDTTALAQVAAASREANELIDRRTFSWTELLNQFQATLPPLSTGIIAISIAFFSFHPRIWPLGSTIHFSSPNFG